MQFLWDESKRQLNIRKHGIDFVGCEAVFTSWVITVEDDRYAYHEYRFITFGLLDNRVIVIAHTETLNVIRIISIRKADRHEQTLYFQNSPFNRITN